MNESGKYIKRSILNEGVIVAGTTERKSTLIMLNVKIEKRSPLKGDEPKKSPSWEKGKDYTQQFVVSLRGFPCL
ncbi:hypothetical protein D3C76_1374350 [compost metagenome]